MDEHPPGCDPWEGVPGEARGSHVMGGKWNFPRMDILWEPIDGRGRPAKPEEAA